MVAEPKVRVAWSPRGNPAQMRLLKCQVFEIFFGGARGGGKTDGVLGEFGAHASRYGKDAIGLMVRRTRAELVETIERSREIYGPLGWQLNETEKMWRAPDGARLRFAYLERDADADMYQGHNYTRVYVEEVGNFPSPAPVMKLMATLRSGAGVDGRVLPRGCMVRYREWYGMRPGEPNVGLKLHAEEVGKGILEREQGETISYGVLDPSAFKEDGGPSIAERIARGS